jgi:hypothetical protein
MPINLVLPVVVAGKENATKFQFMGHLEWIIPIDEEGDDLDEMILGLKNEAIREEEGRGGGLNWKSII